MALAKYVHKTGETLNYQIDFSEWLATDEHIISVTVSVYTTAGTPLTVGYEIINSGKAIQYTVSGGVAGGKYYVSFYATTDASQTTRECVEIEVKDVC